MFQKLVRIIKIAHSQLSNHNFLEVVALVIRSLFKVEQILIFARDLHHSEIYSGNKDMDGHVRKGERAMLEESRKNANMSCWEFSCDLYDGVKDFFIYQNDGLIGHISWIYYKNDPNRLIDLKAGEAEVKYSLTLPQFRGQGIYPAILLTIQRYLKDRGFKRMFICVKEDNQPSLRGIEKAGFIFVTKISLIKVLGLQLSKRYATSH